jgi:hypothetical protein
MHDPKVVAHEILRPWPQTTSMTATGTRGDNVRWKIRHYHDCGSWCADDPPHREGVFPWWKISSYSRFWRIAGRDYFWPAIVIVWHVEPGGRDALSVCQHRYRDRQGNWKFSHGWRWHVHHWQFQFPPLQHLRRYALTRCAWCGGRSRKGDPVNVSHQWDGPRGHWWKGEPGLFHSDCSSVMHAQGKCFCVDPLLDQSGYGQCQLCGGFRAWGENSGPDEADRILRSIPPGGRITPDLRPQVEEAWAIRRARREFQ